MKRHACDETIRAFCEAVYPVNTDLAMTVNGEEEILQEATRLILAARAPDPEKAELLRRAEKAEADRDALQAQMIELAMALDNYSEHRIGCLKRYRSDREECSCGLDDILARYGESK